MLRKLAQYYQIFCNLSLDVVAGVWCCMLPLPACFHIAMPRIWYAVLPLAVWIIYLADHIIDVTRKEKEYPTPRHRFIKKHVRFLIPFVCILVIVTGFFVWSHFNKTLFICGLVMSTLVILHLLIVRINPEGRSWLNNKEFAVAFVYASGIYAGPVAERYASGQSLLLPLLCYLLFACVSYINLLMGSIIEHDYDEQMGNSSLTRIIPLKKAEQLFFMLAGITFSLSTVMVFFAEKGIGLLVVSYSCIAGGHLLIYLGREKLMHYLVYRKLAELLFWLPGLVYLFYY